MQQLGLLLLIPSRLTLQKLMLTLKPDWFLHQCLGRPRLWKSANPLAVKGQIIGSCHMGLGQVLTEKMVYGRTGHLQNANLLEYKIPSVHEMPHVEAIIVDQRP